jgi:hypothetical protein
MLVRLIFAVAVGVFLALPISAGAQIGDLQASYDFLMTDRGAGGVLFSFSNAPLVEPGRTRQRNAPEPPTGTYLVPGSFYDTAAYWGAFVCERSRTICAVNDTYNPLSYELSPAPGPAGKLQAERVNAHNGANIYDVATWQIAVMLGSVKNHFHRSTPTSAYAFASAPSEILQQGALLSDRAVAPGAKRATTAANTFVYNGRTLADGRHAYAFRTLAPDWLAHDPLMGSAYASFVSAHNLPPSNPDYAAGKMSWADWKPITGENAWAFLIGPLQAAHLHYVVDQQARFIPFNDPAVQNALDILPAFAAMQSRLGGVYYAPAGTIGNEGDSPVNPYGISVENNLSLYAGLQILRATLQAEAQDGALAPDAQKRIKDALQLIEVMIAGGKNPQVGKGGETRGLLSFFKNAAWQNGGFVQGGLADDPAQSREWVPTTEPKAVDVVTWGIAALGAKQIDQWFGAGAAFEMWQGLKSWAGYGVGKTLWGVGYSDQDGNGIDPAGAYRQGVMSAEWTAGAVDAVRNMLHYYGTSAQPDAKKYVERLQQDEAAMVNALGALRIDRYASTDFPGKPADYASLVPMKTKPYLYASRRYHIPFGWFANPLPSTASTAWVIMIADRYDPFGVGGSPN